ncbi:bifunctional folylpolyglutamate synthase/dihydrofolate synthase [Aliikangiella marina]|uniref:Dihydrofolate synthase/folylpolyglutamate synthase n=1 Tax=Aliikangiella marina TaxID=1712262 RepID=A0A545TJW4_9GAMM|nr:folylpolyglutamate synthase/dihydrofolate synthase family protein [Aliikangiella marina]TQV77476.1 bifunctional folylpolyglutamate synthase/dihydrofolate synthase [Aliikangiella marina]
MNRKNLNQWLTHIESFHPEEIELGLARIKKVAERLNLFENNGKVILVGGTNGKGSCVAVLEAIALIQHKSVLTYTSPHLVEFNERIRINGKPVTDEQLVAAFEAIEDARHDTALTFFEFTTLAALVINRNLSPDLAVLEVGLGGRLDAVNIVEPEVSVITTIGLDHTDWLGETLIEIAGEKAGISRANKTTLVGDKASLELLQQLPSYQTSHFRLISQPTQVESAAINDTTRNPYQLLAQNILLGKEAFDLAFNTRVDVSEVLPRVVINGRCQVVCEEPTVVVDVAHNPQAATNLASQLTTLKAQTRSTGIVAICGMMRDKAIAEVFNNLASAISEWHFVDLEIPRAATASELLSVYDRLSNSQKAFVHESVSDAFESVTNSHGKEQMILVFGSFITVGNMIQYMKHKQ